MRKKQQASAALVLFATATLLSVSCVNAYEIVDVVDGGTIVGEVKVSGTPPVPEKITVAKDQEVCGRTEKTDEAIVVGKNHGLQNVFVSILAIRQGKGFPAATATLDQRDCRYTPHVVVVPAGKPLSILNSDGILHSVRTHSVKNPAFHKAQSKFKKEMQETFLQPEVIKITCDVHSWMSGWVIVHEHPYAAVSGADGAFSLADVPAGEYTVRFWHETLGERDVLVTVRSGESVKMIMRFDD